MGESTGEKGEPQIVARCLFEDFGQMQKALEDRGVTPLSAEHEYICMAPTELPEDQATEVMELIDKLEQDEDVRRSITRSRDERGDVRGRAAETESEARG